MPAPKIEDVRRILESGDRDLKIRAAIDQAWAEVQAKYPDRAWWRRASTLRHVMWEQSIERVMEVVEGDPNLVYVPQNDTGSFIADDRVLFRLKKANRGFLSSNYPTPLANLFHRHSVDLYGHEGFQRVEIVHMFNRLQTALEWIGVVARDGKKVIWDFELRRRDGQVLPFPVAPTLPAGKTVVRPNVPEVGDQSENAE